MCSPVGTHTVRPAQNLKTEVYEIPQVHADRELVALLARPQLLQLLVLKRGGRKAGNQSQCTTIVLLVLLRTLFRNKVLRHAVASLSPEEKGGGVRVHASGAVSSRSGRLINPRPHLGEGDAQGSSFLAARNS